MIVLRWTTDLHLDHAPLTSRDSLLAALADGEMPLVITGDIATAPSLVASLEAVAARRRAPVYFVLGNHDYFHGQIGAVRDSVIDLAARNPAIRWLPPAGVIMLGDRVALVGVDGWADGREGNAMTTPFVLNDDRWIAEIAGQPARSGKLFVKRALADADAARLRVLLDRAVMEADRVVIATHVPPFAQLLPRTGHLTRVGWLPLLVSGATGSVIRDVATAHPEKQFLVIAGHSHVATDVRLAANLRGRVGVPGQIEAIDLR